MNMSARVYWGIAAVLLLAGCQAAPSPEPTARANPPEVPPPSLLDRAWLDRSAFLEGLAPSQRPGLDRLRGASVYHILLTIDDDLAGVTGQEEVLYTNGESLALSEIDLRLYPNSLGGEMTVDSLTINDAPIDALAGDAGSVLRVPLPTPLPPGGRAVVRTDFETRVPADTGANYGVLSHASDVLAFAHGYPMIAVFDQQGWDRESPPTYGDVVYADASFYLVRVDAPKDLVLVASGSEIAREVRADRQVVTFAAGPARDFYLAASRGYTMRTRTEGPVTLRVYANAEDSRRAEMILDTAADALGFFSSRFGDYPYTELDIVATPNLALGIEYPGVFAVTDRLLTEAEDFGGTPESMLLEPVVAHETGHQWFYNLVGNDQVRQPWLDESLTQFVTLQYMADKYGQAGEQGMRQSFYARWDRVNRNPLPIGKPVSAYSEIEYGAIVYGLGPLRIEALQDKMGTATFQRFLREYVADNSWAIVSTDGWKSLAEKRCGCDLTAEFEQWIYPE